MTTPLVFDILARDAASQAFTNVAGATGKASKAMQLTTSVAGQLGRQLGGELGEILGRTSEGLEQVGEHGMSMGARLMATGGAVTAVGVMMQRMASADQQAEEQLKASIEATGGSWSDYSEEVEKSVSAGEKYGHKATDTMAALQSITQATQDPTTAIEDMSVVEDLAAAKHESLADAAGQLAKVYGGSGRVLKQFGVDLQTGGDKTANAQKAIEELAGRLSGQADASVDNFDGRVRSVTAHIEDWAAVVAGKIGPALTTAGPIILGVGAILESRVIPNTVRMIAGWFGFSRATEEAVVATEEETAALEEQNTVVDASTGALDANTEAVTARVGVLQTALFSTQELTATDEALQLDLLAELGAIDGSTAALEANTAAREANATAAGEQAASAGAAGAASAGGAEVAGAGAVAGEEAGVAAAGISAVGAAAAIALPVAALAGLAFWKIGDDAKTGAVGVDQLAGALEESNGAISDSAREVAFKALSDADAYQQARALGISVNDVTDAALGNADAMGRVRAATSDTENRYKEFANAADAAHVSVNDLSPGLDQQNSQAKALSKTLSASNDNLQKAIQETKDHAEVTEGDAAATAGSEANAAQLQTTISDLADTYGTSTSQISKWAGELGITDAQIKAGSVSTAAFTNAVNLSRDAEAGATSSQGDLIKAMDTYRASAQGAADKATLIGATLRASQGDALSYGAAIAADKTASDALVSSWDSAQRSSVNWKTGMIDLTTAGAGPLIGSLQKMQDAATQAAAATYQHELATEGSKQAADDAAAVFRGATYDALVKDAGALGITAGQAKNLADKYFAMPQSVTTDVEAEGLSAAVDTAHDLEVMLADMNGHHYTTYLQMVTIGGDPGSSAAARMGEEASMGHHAVGGDLTPGRSMIDEYGPEEIDWGGPGTTPHIVANAQARSAAVMSSGGGVTYNVTVQGNVTAVNDLAVELEQIHDRRNRNNGRPPVFGMAPRS